MQDVSGVSPAGGSTPDVAGEARAQTILVFDSGLGGLTVLSEIARVRPEARLIFAADDAAFPYGRLEERELIERVRDVVGALIARFAPDIVVIACNTASTLVLAPLRARFPDIPFVGTVPAVKPAAELSRSRLVSVLATPATVERDYTRDLVRRFAGDCAVTLVGSSRLAALAERRALGLPVDDAAIRAEIAPCFVKEDDRRTDVVALACTHYPLLLDDLVRLSPWPARFIDPAPAIARRVDQLSGPALALRPAPRGVALFTGAAEPDPAMRELLVRYRLDFQPGAARPFRQKA
jgi:glutamate racemase